MIKSKNGKGKMKGTFNELVCDFGVITNRLAKAFEGSGIPKEEAQKLLRKAFELGLKTEEELHEEAKKALIKLLSEEEEKDNE